MPRELRGWFVGRKSDHEVRGRPENYKLKIFDPDRDKKG